MSSYNLRSKAREEPDACFDMGENDDPAENNEILKNITTVVFIMLIGCVFLGLLLNKTSYSYS